MIESKNHKISKPTENWIWDCKMEKNNYHNTLSKII